jgi:ATP-dependent RNA helicase DeaD
MNTRKSLLTQICSIDLIENNMTNLKNFADLGIAETILPALIKLGYEAPSPVQEQSIPILLENHDLFAQAQTGTGKTAAFALPILTKLSLKQNHPQALILVPTRELALQVAEAFRDYAKYMQDFHVLPIYGGQEYNGQLKALKRGVHVVVGTPGRVMDHLKRGTLKLDRINTVILDEADEMLRMGFFEDVTWILDQLPENHQTALFSATIPTTIRKIAKDYLHEPQEVRINPQAKTVTEIKQQYMLVSQNNKLEALTRFLEVEEFDAMLIFTRTKNGSTELAEKLEARGYAATALNGDMKQSQRERVIAGVKRKAVDIIVATDVAARGIDIERVSHVISYDVPYDSENYVHRIGRTGRAGREGKAVLFVTPRENYILRDIERAMKQPIAPITFPSAKEISIKRAQNFTTKISNILAKSDLTYHRELVEYVMKNTEHSALDIAIALTRIVQKEKPPQEIVQETGRFEERKKPNHNRRGNFKRDKQSHSNAHGPKRENRKHRRHAKMK